MTAGTDKVRRTLRCDADALRFLEKLDDNACEQLAAHLKSANSAHHRHIENSMQEALNHFPRIIRGAVKKLFGASK